MWQMWKSQSRMFVTHFAPGWEEKGREAAIPLLSPIAQSEHPCSIILGKHPVAVFWVNILLH